MEYVVRCGSSTQKKLEKNIRYKRQYNTSNDGKGKIAVETEDNLERTRKGRFLNSVH